MSNEQYIERLEQLIRVLQSLTPHEKRRHFDMEQWGYKNECGTVCCAAGHAARDPWFKRRGFKMVKDISGSPVPSNARHLLTISYDGKQGWDALAEFFGVDRSPWWSPTNASATIFLRPTSVGGVIKAAKARIKELKQQAATR
jgi:hypothetical protein